MATGRIIGTGLQYVVYDMGNGRVLKIPTSRMRKAVMLLRWRRCTPRNVVRGVRQAERIGERSIRTVRARMPHLDASLLGYPRFRNGLAYEQDLAMTMGAFMQRNGSDDRRAVLELYMEHVLRMWEYGISDTVFNFTMNSGVGGDGRIILIDLGELCFSRSEAAALVRGRRWLRSWSFRSMHDRRVKEYFRQRMGEVLTLENLERRWGRRQHVYDRRVPAPA